MIALSLENSYDPLDVYVTDYTANPLLDRGRSLKAERRELIGQKNGDELAKTDQLLPIGFFGDFATMAANFKVGQFYRLRNLALLLDQEFGNLKGRVKTFGAFESKDVVLISPRSEDTDVVEFLQ